ncbi:MAG: hypothetical protein LBN37_05495 [Bacteroidales bacterium]|jgi:plasmid stabilization system protein ParE|nr:hypothetical protein [Bacteroidales bacterium]
MQEYQIRVLPEAMIDINDVYHYIVDELCAPLTANNYRKGIFNTINKLRIIGGALAVSPQEYLQGLYGPGARTIVYKKMTIVYSLIDDIVIVRRVMASRMVK